MEKAKVILIIDNGKSDLFILNEVLKEGGYNPVIVTSKEKIERVFKSSNPSIVFINAPPSSFDYLEIYSTIKKYEKPTIIAIEKENKEQFSLLSQKIEKNDAILAKPFEYFKLFELLDMVQFSEIKGSVVDEKLEENLGFAVIGLMQRDTSKSLGSEEFIEQTSYSELDTYDELPYRLAKHRSQLLDEIKENILTTEEEISLSQKVKSSEPPSTSVKAPDESGRIKLQAIERLIQFGKFLLIQKLDYAGAFESFRSIYKDEKKDKNICTLIKIPSFLSDNPDFESDFLKNIKEAENLSHPNILRILEWGKIDDTYYITLEDFQGKSLRTVLNICKNLGGTLDPYLAIYIISEILKAFDYAHNLKDDKNQPAPIFHHNLSPSSIVISYNGEVKVFDFCISRILTNLQNSEKYFSWGQLGYFSPEQALGQPMSELTDIYSLGLILFEMITGESPFMGKNRLEVLELVKEAEILLPSTIFKDLPSYFDDVISRACAKNPKERYPSAKAMLDDLYKFTANVDLFLEKLKLGKLMQKMFKKEIEKEVRRLDISQKELEQKTIEKPIVDEISKSEFMQEIPPAEKKPDFSSFHLNKWVMPFLYFLSIFGGIATSLLLFYILSSTGVNIANFQHNTPTISQIELQNLILPVLLKTGDAKIPPDFKNLKVEGKMIIFKGNISPSGTLENMEIEISEADNEKLDNFARNFVKSLKFEPVLIDGKPASVPILLPLYFEGEEIKISSSSIKMENSL